MGKVHKKKKKRSQPRPKAKKAHSEACSQAEPQCIIRRQNESLWTYGNESTEE